MLDTAGLEDLRGYLKRRLAYGRYRVGLTWENVPLSGVEVMSNGVVRAKLNVNWDGPAGTVNRVELYNTDRELFAYRTCSIRIEEGQTGLLIWIDFNITNQ